MIAGLEVDCWIVRTSSQKGSTSLEHSQCFYMNVKFLEEIPWKSVI